MGASFRDVKGPDGEEFLSIFMDDICISTEADQEDSDDQLVEKHIKHCECFLRAAKKRYARAARCGTFGVRRVSL